MSDSQGRMGNRNVSRRGLFRGLLASGKQTIEQAAVPATPPLQRPLPRPPQALAEPQFLLLCNGCGKCTEACPVGMLRIEQDKVALSIEHAECDFCGACTQACESGALDISLPGDTGLRPVILPQCLGRIDDLCRMCEIECPRTAIFFNQQNQPSVDTEKCDGCGKCKLVCYHGDIRLSLKLHDS